MSSMSYCDNVIRSCDTLMSTTTATTSAIATASGRKPLLGHALQLRNDPLAFFESVRDQVDVMAIRLGPRQADVVSSPELIREVLVSKARSFDKGAQIQGARGLLGNGLISAEGDQHRRQRLMMQPAFRRDRIESYASAVRDEILARLATWQDGAVFDARVQMTGLTLAVAAKTLISSAVGAELATEMQYNVPRLLELMFKQILTAAPLQTSTWANTGFRRTPT